MDSLYGAVAFQYTLKEEKFRKLYIFGIQI